MTARTGIARVVRRLLVVVPILPLAGSARPNVSVRTESGRVSIQARLEPLVEVLSRFAEATGAEVVYESARPRQVVSVGIDAPSQAEALSQLLEGQGLNYVLRLDGDGRAVRMVVISGTSAAATPSVAASGRRPFAPQPQPEVEPVEEEPEPIVPAALDDGGEAPEEAAPPAGTAPQGFVPGSAPEGNAGAPAVAGTPGASSFVPSPPQFPQPGSYPGPAPPGFPRPVSYP